jgi:CHAT domain-containing protein
MIMMGLEEEFNFPRLDETRLLAKRLNMIFDGKVDILQGPDATYSNLIKKPLMDYRFMVYGMHGVLDYQPNGILEPALLLTQTGNPEGQDGFLTMSEIMNLKFDADCCALTACQTGAGKHLKGEGVMCLGRAFQFAGTRSVLMSLWVVAEESSILLTERFFYHVKSGKSHLEALRMARMDVRQEGYEHPFYWAAFILIGE